MTITQKVRWANFIALIGWLIVCPASAQSSWSKVLPGLGTFSSPRVTDLNRDGIGDIILGAGRLEFQACDSAIIALDGRTGELLWRNSAIDQIFGSATLKDITSDGIEDVVIEGRSAELRAIDGATGKVLWKFDVNANSEGGTKRWFNFYNPQFIPDQDGDGIEDLLVSNGGDVNVKPYDPLRPAGRLVVLSSKNGVVLAEALMPDGKETYMSVSVLKSADNEYRILFGTGGETIGGNLFVGTLKNVLSGDLSSSVKIATSPDKGFIAPAAWVEINGDGVPDIVANSVDGRLLAFDGKTLKPLWSVKMEGTEAYSSIAVGRFTDDSVPDFFVSYAQGVWPKLEGTKQFMVNGKTGQVEFSDSLGYYQTCSPVVADLNADGRDEALLSVNYQVLDSVGRKSFFNNIMVIEFGAKEVVQLMDGLPGHNISSTPWIGDLDNDNYLDIVFCHGNNRYQTYTFDGLQVNCLKTKIAISSPIRWGAYMGSHYDGVFGVDHR
ncbi:MAG: PQQ-like beta-propeller repeat protein [Cytophagaceae bacterium]|nr:PQQ-like beta-propeller repeat protein [Cytophagaceae bacterium]